MLRLSLALAATAAASVALSAAANRSAALGALVGLCRYANATYTEGSHYPPARSPCASPPRWGWSASVASECSSRAPGRESACGCAGAHADYGSSVVVDSVTLGEGGRLKEWLCRTEGLERELSGVLGQLDWAASAYVGYANGLLHYSPATNWGAQWNDDGNCTTAPAGGQGGRAHDYEVRGRRWFSAAMTSKDVAIVVDVSARSSEVDRLTRSKSAVLALIASLSPTDYAAVVAVSENTVTLMAPLQLCDDAWRSNMTAFVTALSATTDGRANVTAGLAAAYAALQEAHDQGRASNCSRAIAVFSASPATTDTVALAEQQSAQHANNSVRVFIYSVGFSDADDFSASLYASDKEVACTTHGIWAPLADTDASWEARVYATFSEYHGAAMAEQHAADRVEAPIVLTTYEDYLSHRTVTTLSMACVWNVAVPPRVLAVAAVDLVEGATVEAAFLSSLGSPKCRAAALGYHDIEALRGDRLCGHLRDRKALVWAFLAIYGFVIVATVACVAHKKMQRHGHSSDSSGEESGSGGEGGRARAMRMCRHFTKYGADAAFVRKATSPTACCSKCGRVAQQPALLCRPVPL
eukprot:m51a1_g958 hypothetical protein (584) ;mRNA; f:315566-318076